MAAVDEAYPTNTDIMAKLNDISEKQAVQAVAIQEQQKIIENMGISVRELQDWQIAFKAAEAALANAKVSKIISNGSESPYTALNKDLLKLIGQVVVLVGAVVSVVYLLVNKVL